MKTLQLMGGVLIWIVGLLLCPTVFASVVPNGPGAKFAVTAKGKQVTVFRMVCLSEVIVIDHHYRESGIERAIYESCQVARSKNLLARY